MKVSREFMRRLVRAYEESLIEIINTVPEELQQDQWTEDLMRVQDIREMTYDPFLQHIEF